MTATRSGGSGFTIPVGLGTGDAQALYTASAAQILAVKKGTSASPDATVNPLVKVERLLEVADAAVVGDGGEACAAILAVNVATTACQVQPIGVYGTARTTSEDEGAVGSGGGDAAGIAGIARVQGNGIGVAIGGFFSGRRDTDTAFGATGAEITTQNYGTVDQVYIPAAGYQKAQGIWVNAKGPYNASCGITFGNADGVSQFDVGIGFTSQVAGGHTGGIVNSSIRDDSHSVTSLDIRGSHTNGVSVGGTHSTNAIIEASTAPVGLLISGTHSTGAIYVTATAGHVGFGVGPPAGAMLMVQTDDAANSVAILKAKATQIATILSCQSSTGTGLFQVGGTGNAVHGEGCNVVYGTSTGTKLGTSASQKLAFYNSTPIIQPSGTPVASTDLATVITLANSLRTNLLALGLVA